MLEFQSQAYVLLMAIKVFAEFAGNAVGHGAKYAAAYNSDMMMSYLQAIVAKTGANPMGYGSYRGGNMNRFGAGGSFSGGNGGFNAGPMGGYSNDGPSATSNQMQLMPPPAPSNDGVSWNSTDAESSTVGQTVVAPVQLVSSLADLMG